MYERKATVLKQIGLHARPATFLIQKANEYKSSIWIEKDERRVNAKSLLGVLSLGVAKDTTITVLADGPDEAEAVDTLCELINSDFAE
ncbi:MAG: HPr family phosphocarrier protein [Oscillospiraceae bacterium]|nr:HPr family phosphocarrier protein [Oscillospiraceae bacterium]